MQDARSIAQLHWLTAQPHAGMDGWAGGSASDPAKGPLAHRAVCVELPTVPGLPGGARADRACPSAALQRPVW